MRGVPVLRAAAIHDLSGFGRASLTVAIPVLATMGIQACPLPTAVLSSQTSGVEGFSFLDLTGNMARIMDHWADMGLRFDAVYSGFLGSPEQSGLAARCIMEFLAPDGLAVVDPVMGDNGRLDPTQTPEMVEAMRMLVSHADVITPNIPFATIATPCPSCLGVTATVSSYTNNTVTLSWVGNDAGSYNIYNDTNLVASAISDTTYTFTSLTGHTTYNFGVQTACSATEASSINYVTVTTLSDPTSPMPIASTPLPTISPAPATTTIATPRSLSPPAVSATWAKSRVLSSNPLPWQTAAATTTTARSTS